MEKHRNKYYKSLLLHTGLAGGWVGGPGIFLSRARDLANKRLCTHTLSIHYVDKCRASDKNKLINMITAP
jgi:hypothetical protein